MPGVEFASDRSGSFPELKLADGGEGRRGKNTFFVRLLRINFRLNFKFVL